MKRDRGRNTLHRLKFVCPSFAMRSTILILIFCIGASSIGQTAEQSKPLQAEPTGSFQVKVNKGELSLEASQAPLARVLEEIGKQAGIRIDTNIAPEVKITTSLNRVPIEDGIKKLARNVTVFYAQGPDDKSRRIERVVILSEVKERPSPQPKSSPEPEKGGEPSQQPAKVDKPSPRPEPFKFEFDPRKAGEKQKPGK